MLKFEINNLVRMVKYIIKSIRVYCFQLDHPKVLTFFHDIFNFFINSISVFKFLDNSKFCISVEVMIRTSEVSIGANCVSSTDILTMFVEPKFKGRLNFSNILIITFGTIREVYYVGTYTVHLVV